jgi:predicted Zn-dependent protease
MKSFFALVCIFLVFSSAAAQSRTGSSQGRRNDVSGALSQMEGAVAAAQEDVLPLDAYFLGRAVAANIVDRYKLWTRQPEAEQYMNKICAALAVNSPMPDIYNGYHVMILDSQELNAFASSGGHIFITRGLMTALAAEDALAAVLAHEIAHIQLQHGVALIRSVRITRQLSGVADSAAAIAAREASLSERKVLFDNSVRDMVSALILNGYTQEQEFQADIYALKLLTLAGYSPSSLGDVLALLEKNPGSGGFNGTHPSPARRIANVRQELARNRHYYQVENTASFRASRFEASIK